MFSKAFFLQMNYKFILLIFDLLPRVCLSTTINYSLLPVKNKSSREMSKEDLIKNVIHESWSSIRPKTVSSWHNKTCFIVKSRKFSFRPIKCFLSASNFPQPWLQFKFQSRRTKKSASTIINKIYIFISQYSLFFKFKLKT